MSGADQPRRAVSFHVIGDAAVLFDPARRRLFALGADEATAWCLLCEHGEAGQTAAALARESGRPLA